MLEEFAKKFTTPSQIKKVVPYCTVHKQFGKERACLVTHVNLELRDLWLAMRHFLEQRGAKDFADLKPRGPLFRQLLERIQKDSDA